MKGEAYRNPDGHWQCDFERYHAVVHSGNGNLLSLKIGDAEALAPQATSFTPTIVRLAAHNSVCATDGNYGVWWYFHPDAVSFVYAVNEATDPAFVLAFSEAVSSAAAPARLAPRYPQPGADDTPLTVGDTGIALANDTGVTLAVQALAPEVVSTGPTVISVGFPPGVRLAGEIQIGAPAEELRAAELSLDGPHYHLFPATGELRFSTTVTLSGEATAGDLAVMVLDYNTAALLAGAAQPLQLTPGEAAVVEWSIPWRQAGVFAGSMRLRVDGCAIAAKPFAFAYDLEHWRPEQYRPDDFWEFWQARLAEMRAMPLDPKMELIAAKSTADYQVHEVEIAGANGRRISGEYGEPAADGSYMLTLTTPHPGKDLAASSTDRGVMVAGRMEDAARYRLHAGDIARSNLLHVYLDYVRWIDFACSRGKVDENRVLAPAGSRGGPMVIAAAALDPRVKLITMNVGTCNRWDWQVQHTGGWGPDFSDRMPGQTMAEFLAVLAYFDPTHFAERVTIPVAASWGMLDGLSPLNGQLSMWVNLSGPRFLELRPWGGHDSHTPECIALFARLTQELSDYQTIGPDSGPLGVDWQRGDALCGS